MKRKLFSAILFGALLATSTSGLTSCKDYDDDIQNLQTQIDANSAAIKAIQDKIAAGVILKSVNPISNGIEVLLENGTSYKITNGATGATGPQGPQGPQGETGKAGSVVTMGDNGNWFIDGVDTGKPWKGKDGVSTGVSGTFWAVDITDPTTPKLVKWVDGVKTDEAFEIPTDDDCVSAVWDTEKQVLTLANVIEIVGGEEVAKTIEISLAAQLTSLVFVPESYVYGVEAIKFATLKYTDWSTDTEKWLADAAESDDEYAIDDATTTVEYLVNPMNVSLNDIVSLSYISNEATQVRSANPEAPIVVAEKALGENEKGATVLKLNLKKANSNEIFASATDEKFTIVALKAEVKDNVGENKEVFSDWARLVEVSATPKIHYAEAEYETDANAHFWKYTEAYPEGIEGKQPNDQNGAKVIKDVPYDESIDLNELVDVCDEDGNIYDAESFGLKFEFNLLSYKLNNEGNTTDATDQKGYAKLTEDGVLSSTVPTASADATTAYRDAIGRQPMIQVVLKDVNDPANVKVVDVRYFKIKWIDKDTEPINYKGFTLDTRDYACGEEIEAWVLEGAMNELYSDDRINMNEVEFWTNYQLDGNVYADAATAKAGTPALTDATIELKRNESAGGQTHNLLLKYNTANDPFKATQDNYNAGKKTVTVYGVIKSTTSDRKIIFPLTQELTINKMVLDVNKDMTLWSDDVRTVNPILLEDANFGSPTLKAVTIQGNLLAGYIKDGQTPASYNDLVKYDDKAKFVFDESKLGEVAEATGTLAEDWEVVNDGLILKYKTKYAATIHGSNGTIILRENPAASASAEGTPTTAAKLLVGKSVPVKLVSYACESGASTGVYAFEEKIASFDVKFLTPLAFDSRDMNVEVQDLVGGGSTSTQTFEIKITEAFTVNQRLVYSSDATAPVITGLKGWYVVTDPVYAADEALTNLNVDGGIDSDFNTELADIRKANGDAKYTITVNNNGTVTFKNMSGNAIAREFKIKIPVTVETKWQTMKTYIIVTVKPGI